METLIKNIREKVEEALPDKNYFVVDVSLKGGKGHQRLEILVDGDEGIDISICARLNKDLSDWLDATDLMSGHYILEVGSPGVDYPLSLERQYKRNIGRELNIILKDDSVITGKLRKVETGGLKIETSEKGKRNHTERKIVNISLEEIRKSTVIVSFK